MIASRLREVHDVVVIRRLAGGGQSSTKILETAMGKIFSVNSGTRVHKFWFWLMLVLLLLRLRLGLRLGLRLRLRRKIGTLLHCIAEIFQFFRFPATFLFHLLHLLLPIKS